MKTQAERDVPQLPKIKIWVSPSNPYGKCFINTLCALHTIDTVHVALNGDVAKSIIVKSWMVIWQG